LREAYGPLCAFLCGWVFVLAVLPGGTAFLAVGFSIFLDHFIPLAPGMRVVLLFVLVTVLLAIYYIGVRERAGVQRLFTSAKILGLVMVIGAAAFSAHGTRASFAPTTNFSYSGIGYAVTACLMAYNGWSYVSFVAGEIKDPQRNLPRALALGMLLVMVL